MQYASSGNRYVFRCRAWANDTLLNTATQPATEASISGVLYFESDAHYSIHEEMLKVTVLSLLQMGDLLADYNCLMFV